ncbi:cytochrome P450 [Tianweitania sp. Rool2]|uniref:Cytochrome P450 n=1 Tax=Oryzicola mucosus TaxID=2767425 RepID=A0A8J6PP35_9HYPH|nr:cytochrome P450 [Oryzicola mucosus]
MSVGSPTLVRASRAPVYEVDIYSDEVIRDPYPHYRRIRALGAAVWLPLNGLWAIGRHADVRAVLADHVNFRSGHGVSGNSAANKIAPGNLLASDPPLHDHLRRIVAAPLSPRSLAMVKERIEETADALVDRLVQRSSFDGMADLAQYLPVSIVSELVGMPEHGRENMLRWASAVFDMLGGDNERAAAAMPIIMEMRAYTANEATRDKVRPGGWVAMLYDAADQGVIRPEQVQVLMRDYLGPSLDTTIFATGHLMYLLGQNPDQWQMLRDDPTLIPNAINEAVRLESPIRGFTRYAAADRHVGDTLIPSGDRALILYASANRDERRWERPDTFDVKRILTDHVGFGHGIHSCAGMQLARLEIRSIVTAMTKQVKSIQVGEPTLAMNNVLRGYERLPMTFLAA